MNKKHLALAVFIIILYLSPYFLFGKDTPINDWDDLDSIVVWYKVLAESGQIFSNSDSTVPLIMNGLPRVSFGSEFNVILWLYYFFEPFTAYVINEILFRFIAFLGMYLLLQKHLLKKFNGNFVALGVAVTYSILPYWSPGGLSIAGLPLALYAFLNIRDEQGSLIDWIILFLIPFYSSFVLSFVFFLSCLGVLWLFDFIRNKILNWRFLGAIIFMTLIFCLVEYRLIYSMFFSSNFISHRLEFNFEQFAGKETLASFKNVFNHILNGQPHAPSLHKPVILISILCALLISFKKKLEIGLFRKLFTIIFLFSLNYGFWRWTGWIPLKEKISILNSFNFSRFSFLNPLLWYILFAFSLIRISINLKFGKYLASSLILLQILFLFSSNWAISNIRNGNINDAITFNSFYSESLFSQIAKYIEEDQKNYRVISIGLHPSVAQYNGFYTLDGYVANYALQYKHQFRKIISKELSKNTEWKNYFDNFGSRCYIFVDELDNKIIVRKQENIKINNLKLETITFKEMGGKYIFSAVEILNYKENKLKFLKSFENDNSIYKIFLYEAI